ncbi:MAG TPA: Asp-tRNA(Asn)/Glu-tRNA(Gln) amidotransferase subunit GatC [Alphaproteobacteria bacterium]|jgi:aspartyl-tRNA(Asn)/glutamyl-tRNA(Gln) amidotransferase subunit C|nr:Asp-tRNA(Asn)/Glu-tRNA(Gln) amidotransferase subunit GatC [Alphaproteobacteria bacterium]
MSLDAAAVARIARLARIRVTDDEKTHLASELSQVMDWIDQLQSVDTDGVEPLTSVVGARLKTRADVVILNVTRDDVLANAPEGMAGFFTVPKVVE